MPKSRRKELEIGSSLGVSESSTLLVSLSISSAFLEFEACTLFLFRLRSKYISLLIILKYVLCLPCFLLSGEHCMQGRRGKVLKSSSDFGLISDLHSSQ